MSEKFGFTDTKIAMLRGFVTTAWCVPGLWMEETSSKIWRVAANKLNKQSWAANKG